MCEEGGKYNPFFQNNKGRLTKKHEQLTSKNSNKRLLYQNVAKHFIRALKDLKKF